MVSILTGFRNPLETLRRNLQKIVNLNGFQKLSNVGISGFQELVPMLQSRSCKEPNLLAGAGNNFWLWLRLWVRQIQFIKL
jgi:hypothetical protein